jgi:hypothetical protein
MFNMTACKPIDEPLTMEEQWVLKVLRDKPIMVLPKEYYVKMIETIYTAILGDSETMGFVIRLADIHPELCSAVNCLLNGNLEERYSKQNELHRQRIEEINRELGYKS